MMRSRVILVNLAEDGCRVIDDTRFPTEPPETYRGCKGKLCPRKNANRRLSIFRRSKSNRTGIEVLRSQFLTDFSRTLPYGL